MLKVVNLIRELYLNTVIIVDNYDFYYIFDKDVYLVYYLFGFSIRKSNNYKFIRNDIKYLNFLTRKLTDEKINYVVVIKRFGYNVDLEKSFNDNNYTKFYNKGKLVYKRKKEIIKIKDKLKLRIFENKDKICRIRGIINNGV